MFKSKTHETNFNNAMKEVDSDNFATQALIYLLTSETALWGKVKKHFKDGYIDVLSLHPSLSEHHMSQEDFSKILGDAWIRSENPNLDKNFAKRNLVAMFKRADKSVLMDSEERGQLDSFDETVTIYRGVTSYNAKNIKALSWTTDYQTADWFAHRFDEEGTVYEAQIVVALIDNESTLKRFYKDDEHQRVILRAENKKYKDIIRPSCTIQGVAQHVIKRV